MKSVIRYLFGSELSFPRSWREENRYGDLTETVRQLQEQATALLEQAAPGFGDAYQEKIRQLHNLECEREFERGFLLAAELFAELSIHIYDEP